MPEELEYLCDRNTGDLEANPETVRAGFVTQVGSDVHLTLAGLLFRPDEAESCRHTGEGRYPVSVSNRPMDPGIRRGDEFKHHRAASISTVRGELVPWGNLHCISCAHRRGIEP